MIEMSKMEEKQKQIEALTPLQDGMRHTFLTRVSDPWRDELDAMEKLGLVTHHYSSIGEVDELIGYKITEKGRALLATKKPTDGNG